jgi:TolA-binding protein
MDLQHLKKQLKQEIHQETWTKKSRFKLWFIVILVFSVVTAALFYGYQQQQLTAPQRLFTLGVKQESLGKIDAAEKSYRDIYQRYPQASEAAEALLRIGKIWQYDRRDEQKALLSYLQLEHDYPDSLLVLSAREEAAQIVKYTLKDYSRAIEFYQRLLDLNTGHPDQYYYEIADCYFLLENYPQARIELEILLENFPDSPLVPDVLYRKGGILLLEGRMTAAQQDWQSMIEQYPDSSYRLQAQFDLAKLLEEQGALDEALRSYRQIEGFPYPELLQKKIDHLEQRITDKTGAI